MKRQLLYLSFILIQCFFLKSFSQEKYEFVPQIGALGEDYIAFSPDEKTLVTVVYDYFILWDIKSGIQLKKFQGHSEKVSCIAYSPDGKWLASCGWDNKLLLWDIKTGKLIKSFDNNESQLQTVAFTPDGKKILTGASQEKIELWDIATAKVIKSFLKGSPSLIKGVTAIALSPDGKFFFSGFQDNTIDKWSMETGQFLLSLSGHEKTVSNGIIKLIFSKDGKTLASGSADNTIKIWGVITGKEIRTLNGHTKAISSLAFGSDGKTLISGSLDGFLKTWDIINGNEIRIIPIQSFFNVAISNSGKIALADDFIIDLASGTKSNTLKNCVNTMLNCVVCLPDGHTAVAGGNNGSILVFDYLTGQIVKNHSAYGAPIHSIDISPDMKSLLISNGINLKLIDFESGNEIRTFLGHSKTVNSLGISTANKMVVSGADDNNAILWDLYSGRHIRTFTGLTSPVKAVAISSDGKFALLGLKKVVNAYDFATGKPRNNLILWDVNVGHKLLEFSDAGNILSVCISSDNKFALSGSTDSTARLWNISDGKLQKTFSGHKGRVHSVLFGKDGKTCYTGSSDKTIKKWDLLSGSVIETMPVDGIVSNLALSPNGNHLIATTMEGFVRIFNIASKENVTLIQSIDQKEWILFSNDGYWDASPNGGEIVAMVKGMECRNIDQFAAINNRPDLILKKLESPDSLLIKHYFAQYKKRMKKLGLTEPISTFESHSPIVEMGISIKKSQSMELNFTISDSKYPLKSYNIYINNVPLFGAYGKKVQLNKQNVKEIVELTNGENKIEVSCTNSKGVESYRPIIYANAVVTAKPDFYYLGFGVSKYTNPELELKYAHKDALDLAELFNKMKGSAFTNVFTKTYINSEVTPAAIVQAKAFLKTAKPGDTFVLFIAGHGLHDKDAEATYYFLTSDADVNNLKATAADFETIEELLQGIPPRNKLFLMDACESGEIEEEEQEQMLAAATGAGIASRGLKKVSTSAGSAIPKRNYLYQKDRYIYNDLMRRSGTIVFSSSKGGELSYERSDIENGVFTQNIIDALTNPKTDNDNDSKISILELHKSVSKNVAENTLDMQHPVIDRDNIYQKFSFPIIDLITKNFTDVFTDARDNQQYPLITIGTQTWMAKNLNYASLEGSKKFEQPYCKDRLYTYNTAQNVCPSGWHLPRRDEWKEMADVLGGNAIAGGKLKSRNGWQPTNAEATNETGFSALPGGACYNGVTIEANGYTCFFWTSEPDISDKASSVFIDTDSPELFFGYNAKIEYFSVRCIKNQ